MKVLFLDFDGVIVTARSRYQSAEIKCVRALNRVLKETKTALVISSSWRIGRTVPELQWLISSWKVKGLVIDKTPYAKVVDGFKPYESRGLEIEHWLETRRNPPEKFAVVDDDSDIAPFMDKFVKTDYLLGMNEDDADKLIEFLK
jgi:hypothetical protein